MKLQSIIIRIFDLIFSFIGILFFSPISLIIYFLICLGSKGGGFYKQIRVGKNNKDFYIYKFRSMYINSENSGLITIGEKDPRITKIGYFIRKYKLDEIPQLINVIKGDMSIVGPRPEVRKYVNIYTNKQKKILTTKPGITDYASINFINENELLNKSINPEKLYINFFLNEKINYNMIYIQNYGLKEYFKIILLTLRNIIF